MKSVFSEAAFIPFGSIVSDTNDLYRLIEQVEGLSRFLFRDKQGPISIKAGEYLTSNLAIIFKEIEDRGLEPATDDKQADFLRALADYIKNIPLVKITLAFDPKLEFVAQLNREITAVAGCKVVLDISVDESIVGGAKFEYKGKYWSSTLEVQITQVIDSQKLMERGGMRAN